jgi:hypothetical protein
MFHKVTKRFENAGEFFQSRDGCQEYAIKVEKLYKKQFEYKLSGIKCMHIM